MNIGIDHGYGMIKTVNEMFVTGLAVFDKQPPIMEQTLYYGDKYYTVGGSRQPVQSKTENINYYIMTLAAIAKELHKRKVNTKQKIVIGAGLPLTYFESERKDFKNYLEREKGKLIHYQYESIWYDIEIQRVDVFPQGYSAILPHYSDLKGTSYIIDIGSNTIDIVMLDNMTPNMQKLVTIPMAGVINAYKRVNDEIAKVFNTNLQESQIRSVILDEEDALPDKAQEIIKNTLKKYAGYIVASLKEYGINPELSRCFFVGGGAVIIKKYSEITDYGNVVFITDICANAKGYELMLKAREKNK
jgi:plasmid segregation protein ParM